MGYSLFPCQFSKFCLYGRCGWMREQGKVKLLGGLTVHISIAPHSLCLNLRLLKSDDMKITMESDRYYCIGWLGCLDETAADRQKETPAFIFIKFSLLDGWKRNIFISPEVWDVFISRPQNGSDWEATHKRTSRVYIWFISCT